jgi:hypothetical protein
VIVRSPGTVFDVRITAELAYEADPRTVFTMIRDAAFQKRKCVACGALKQEVQIEEHDDGTAVITTHRIMPTDEIPNSMKAFVGSTLTVIQSDEWAAPTPDGNRHGTAIVRIDGAPVTFTATLRLTADGAGARQTISGDLKASVPLLGGKIEKAAEPAIRAAIRAEQRVSTDWLAGT